MVLPIGDAPNPRGTPVVNYLLIAANVAVYVVVALPLVGVRPAPDDPALRAYAYALTQAVHDPGALRELLGQVSAYDLFLFTHGFRAAAPSIADMFASMFLHAGFMHLAGNMLFLWIYGDNVEYRLGPVRYLMWYLLCGVAAVLAQWGFAPHAELPMVGASGAISGVLGFYFVWFPRNTVRLLWLLPPFVMRVFEVRARIVLAIYLLLDNVLPLLVTSDMGGVAHGAHIGGFVAGVAVAWLLDSRAREGVPVGYAGEAGDEDAVHTIADAIGAGRMRDAARAYFALGRQAGPTAVSAEDSLALASWLAEQGDADAALTVLRRHLRNYPRGPGLAEAHVLAGEILLQRLRQPTPAYQHFLAALDVDASPEVAERAHRGLAAIEGLQKRQIGYLGPRQVR